MCTRAALVLCLVSQVACHLHSTPYGQPLRSVARSESAIEQRIATDIHVPDDAEVHIHRMELDGQAPEEVIVEVRCTTLTDCALGEVSYERGDKVATISARAAFYIYNVAKPEHPVSYTAKPLLGAGYTYLERAAPSKLMDDGYDLVMASYILYDDRNRWEDFGQTGGVSILSHYAFTPENIYAPVKSSYLNHGISPELYLDGSLITLRAYTWGYRWEGGAVSHQGSYDSGFHHEDRVIRLLMTLLQEPAHKTYRAGLFMQFLHDLFERVDEPLSSPEAMMLVEQVQSRLMATYDAYRSQGYSLPPLGYFEDTYFSEEAWFSRSIPSVESFFMWFTLEGLSWPTSERVHVWARAHMNDPSSPEELAIMMRLVQDSTPKPFRKGLAATDYEDALDRLEQAALRHSSRRDDHYAYAMSGAEQMHDQYMDQCILYRSTCGMSPVSYDEECVKDATTQTRHLLKSLMSRDPARFVDLLERDVWREDALHVLTSAPEIMLDETIMRSLTRKPEDMMWKGASYDTLLMQLPARVTEDLVRRSSHIELIHMAKSWQALMNDNRAMIRSPNRDLFKALQLALITIMRELADRYDGETLEFSSHYQAFPKFLLDALYQVHDVLPPHEYDEWLHRVHVLMKDLKDEPEVEVTIIQLESLCEALVHYRWDVHGPVRPLMTSEELDSYLQRIVVLYGSAPTTKLPTRHCHALDNLPPSYFTFSQNDLVSHIVKLAEQHNE